MTTKLPRYTPVLVADHAPASGELAGPLIDKARRLEACNVADIDPARVAALEADRDRLALEVAALRGAMPRADALDAAAAELKRQHGDTLDLDIAAARIRALTATPQPAEAVTGAEWGRGDWKIEHGDWHWLLIEGDPGPTQWEWYEGGGPPDDESWWVRDGYEPEGRVLIVGPPVSPPPGWEAALDTPQEADHAAQ